MQTVLVAGGAGFIGHHLCKSLLDDGYKIICVDNFLTSDAKNICFLSNLNFKFIKHDVAKPLDSIKYKIPSIKYIFHLASPASPNQKSPEKTIEYFRSIS